MGHFAILWVHHMEQQHDCHSAKLWILLPTILEGKKDKDQYKVEHLLCIIWLGCYLEDNSNVLSVVLPPKNHIH